MVDGVVFDVGCTLLDESHRWRGWAQSLGIPANELEDSVKVVIAEGRNPIEAIRRLVAETHWRDTGMGWERALKVDEFVAADLYPDVRPCIAMLRARGIKLGAAGNTSVNLEHFLKRSGLGFEMVGSSARWKVEKPDLGFFRHVIQAMALPAERLIYVGDRIDNDVRPAAVAGMKAVFLRRGPWAEMQSADGGSLPEVYAVIDSLEELPSVVSG
jgi:HAD superfamily hydrolase (TIGR01662 family)